MRLAVDLDAPSELELLRRYLNLRGVAETYGSGFQARRSSGGRGYHLVAYGVDAGLWDRAAYGDDPGRIHFDEVEPGKPPNVLYRRRGRRECEAVDVLALPFWSRVPRGYSRNSKGERST